MLRGKCRYCKVAIPFRYVGFEFLVGVMVAGGAYGYQWRGILGMGLGLLWLIPALVWIYRKKTWHQFMFLWVLGVCCVWFGFLGWLLKFGV